MDKLNHGLASHCTTSRLCNRPLANLQGQLATERLKFLKDKVEKAKALDELDSIYTLVKQQQEELEPALNEDDQLRKKRLEQEEKEHRNEDKKDRIREIMGRRKQRIVRPEDLLPAKPLLKFPPFDFKSSFATPCM